MINTANHADILSFVSMCEEMYNSLLLCHSLTGEVRTCRPHCARATVADMALTHPHSQGPHLNSPAPRPHTHTYTQHARHLASRQVSPPLRGPGGRVPKRSLFQPVWLAAPGGKGGPRCKRLLSFIHCYSLVYKRIEVRGRDCTDKLIFF